jgi:hypothetical protein
MNVHGALDHGVGRIGVHHVEDGMYDFVAANAGPDWPVPMTIASNFSAIVAFPMDLSPARCDVEFGDALCALAFAAFWHSLYDVVS